MKLELPLCLLPFAYYEPRLMTKVNDFIIVDYFQVFDLKNFMMFDQDFKAESDNEASNLEVLSQRLLFKNIIRFYFSWDEIIN